MRWSERRTRIFQSLSLGEKVAGTLAILALLILKLPQPDPGWLRTLTSHLIPKAVPLAIIALLTQVLARFGRSIIGAPSIWGTVHEMLDHLRDEVLGDELAQSPDFSHRATLFRWRRQVWWQPSTWFNPGWLIPVERSGYTTRRTKCRWRASDDPTEAEGVAGTCWANNGVIVLTHEELPDPAQEEISADERQRRVEAYARASFTSKIWVKERLSRVHHAGTMLASYYCGIPVRVKGRPWGVIVIDSTTTSLKDADEIRKIYTLSGKALGSLLTHDGILKRG